MSLKNKQKTSVPQLYNIIFAFFLASLSFSILYRSHLCLFVTLAQEQRDRLLFTEKLTDKWSLTGTNY